MVVAPPKGLLDDIVECSEMLMGSDGDPRAHAANADEVGVEHEDAGLCCWRLTASEHQLPAVGERDASWHES